MHKQVTTSTPIATPTAAFHNDTIAAIDNVNKLMRREAGNPQIGNNNDGTVLIKNDSGSDAAALAALGISGPIVLPADNEMSFTTRIAVKCVSLITSHVMGKFVVLAEPIKNGKIGRAWISGTCPAKIYVDSADHDFADITDGILKTCENGTCQILWQEPGTGANKYALLRFCGNGLPIGTANYQTLSWDHTEQKWKADWVRSHW